MANPELDRKHNMVCPDVAGYDPSPYVEASERQSVTPDSQPDINEPFAVSMARYVMQSIIAESPYRPDFEWDLPHIAQQLEDENGLPPGVSAEDIVQAYFRVFHHD